MAKIVVTGGAGFIGSHLVDKLIDQGHQVVVIDNLLAGKKENISPKAEFYQLDICDFQKISPVFQGADFVFHLAAIPRVPLSVEDPVATSQTNIMGAINVFKAGIDHKVKRIVFASSSSVYGNQEQMPLKEDMQVEPVSPYGAQKLVGEQFARLFTDLYKVPIICLRYFNVFGPRVDFDSEYSLVIGKFLKQHAEGRALTICGDGEQTRGFCYVDDVNNANIKAMQSEKLQGSEVINIGSKKSHTVNYLAELIGNEIKYLPARQGDVLHTRADINKARDLLGWEPEVSFEQGVKKTSQWFSDINKR